MLLWYVDPQLPDVAWGLPLAEIERLYPAGRIDAEIVGDPQRGTDPHFYRVSRPLVGYPYPVVLTFLLEPGLRGLTVEFPREFNPATGEMAPPGRMVSQSVQAHLESVLTHALGRPLTRESNLETRDPVAPLVTGLHWRSGDAEIVLEARSRLGSGWVSVRMTELAPVEVDRPTPGEPRPP